ncbi:hypothetical protein PEPNEM18_00695 [Aedoeadaptatus nemausensis]|uniref:Lipoprotein n=1 Tax=Aedoeadaptatus nemausensis TaxID=2582829 RepID=A0A6V6Y1D2_9FIRM|nr:hypothetical protein [Peptoniphilus nemausensis]CAC9928629.1 hypothetical protein PEPNEM18_00695 [Peptoniphilus nemausensis]
MKRTLKTGALALALTLTLAGCGNKAEQAANNAQAAANKAEQAANEAINQAEDTAKNAADGAEDAVNAFRAKVDTTSGTFDLAKYKEGMEEVKKLDDNDAKGTIYKMTDENGDYYLYEGEENAEGYKTVAYLSTKDGKVMDTFYNFIDKDNQLRTNDEEYIKNTLDQTGNDMAKTVAYFEEMLAKPEVDDLDDTKVKGVEQIKEEFEEIADELFDVAGLDN